MAYTEENPELYLVIARGDYGCGKPHIILETPDRDKAEITWRVKTDECEDDSTIYRVETWGRKKCGR
jgi:hypothetical protein